MSGRFGPSKARESLQEAAKMSKGKGKGVGKGQSNRRSLEAAPSGDKSPAEAEADGAVAGPSSGRRAVHHNMQDIAWQTVDTDEEILERGNGKWVNLRITEHQRSSSENEDDSNGRFVYFDSTRNCLEALNNSGQTGADNDVSDDEERDIIYDSKEFTVRAVKKKPEGAEGSDLPRSSSSPSKPNRKGRRKRKNSHKSKADKASTSKAVDKPRKSRGDRKTDRSPKKKAKGAEQPDSPVYERVPSPQYEAAPLIKPPSRRIVVELSSDSEGEPASGDRVQLFHRSPRFSRMDAPRTRGSRYGPAGKPLNAGNEEIDSSPESYRNKAEVALSLSTSGKTKLYLAKRTERNNDKNTWISVRCQ